MCHDNFLTTLDVSKNTALLYIQCNGNQLATLDVSKNIVLKELYCYNNQLTGMDLSRNTALIRLGCYQNQIKDEAMDRLVESLPTINNMNAYLYLIYNENEGNEITSKQVAAARAKNWIPQYYAKYDEDTYWWTDYDGWDSDVDAIGTIHDEMKDGAAYNLAGQRVKKIQKGIYIINSKKVLK